MKLHKRILVSMGVSVVLAGVSPMAVLAHNGVDDEDEVNHTSQQGDDTTTVDDHSGKSGSSHDKTLVAAEDSGGSLRQRASDLLSDKRQGKRERTQVQRQKACEQRKDIINQRFARLGTKADLYLKRFDTVLTKVQAYQTKNQLAVSNYDELIGDVTVKQQDATTAVAALKSLSDTTVDCTATDPATTVASVKTAAQDARTALQAYRTSLKALVDALLTAKQTTTNTEDN